MPVDNKLTEKKIGTIIRVEEVSEGIQVVATLYLMFL